MSWLYRAVFIVLVHVGPAYGHFVQEYYDLSEENLESYSLDGELESSRYQSLLDYYEAEFESNVDSRPKAFLLQDAFLKPRSAIRRISGETISVGESLMAGLRINYKVKGNYYVDDQNSRPSELYRLGLANDKGWSVILEFKGTRTRSSRIYRRSLEYEGNKTIRRFCFGNYSTDVGLGLNLGRRDYYDGITDFSYDNAGFLEPSSNWYNGVLINSGAGEFGFEFSYSDKNYSAFSKTRYALSGEYCHGGAVYGLIGTFCRIDLTGTEEIIDCDNGGGYILVDNDDYSLGGEFSVSSKSGPAACADFRTSRNRLAIHASAWIYSHNYLNPSSSGISDNDDGTFRIGRSDIDFRSYHRDRFGVFLDNAYYFNGEIAFTGSIAGSARGYEDEHEYQAAVGVIADYGDAPEVRVNFGIGRQSYYDLPSREKFIQGYLNYRIDDHYLLKFEFHLTNRKLEEVDENPEDAGKVSILLQYDHGQDMVFTIGAAAKRRVWISTSTEYTEISVGESLRIFKTGRLTFKYIARRGYGNSTAYIDLTGEF